MGWDHTTNDRSRRELATSNERGRDIEGAESRRQMVMDHVKDFVELLVPLDNNNNNNETHEGQSYMVW